MSHLPILPVLIPFLTAGLLLATHGMRTAARRAVSSASLVALVVVSLLLLSEASDGIIRVYRLGNWPGPFGIVLVADRLAALMVTLTAMLAAAGLLPALSGTDNQGRHFHVFFHLQIAGLNGAFLTGDLFNLFVFFEILLLASYALLAHGGGLPRTSAGLAYVVLNLVGSALFLIALGLTYGTLGTLNMADLALVLPKVASGDQALVRTTVALLAAVFVLKAALLPLGFWLPHVYTAATIPVAVLFVIMTKVGIYALLRVSTIGFVTAPFTADLLQPWLAWLAIGTIAFGSLGALAATRLSVVVANIVMISSGTLLLGIAAGSMTGHAAMLYYLVNTTVVTAGFFLLADRVSRQRGAATDVFEKGPRMAAVFATGGAYLILAMAASGVPPLSGFLGKIMVMQSLQETSTAVGAWTALLLSGFVVALVLARAASTFFWEPGRADQEAPTREPILKASSNAASTETALIGMIGCALVITLGAAPISAYTRATAGQLAQPAAYVDAVLGDSSEIGRERRP
ncbi:monovalent cation/H+ antiporter subunit D [Bradyrhizobium sp.]|uniref:monovalent cation/H+ antiporter subunit D n=1 Tax=Bradyrhizobium sp. TaxID=376 RepID=UPI000A79355E|nr:monovalent cation/H+ antiporter subunit D [Bradyrhizobium sp.]